MSNFPFVSIIIVNFNGKHFLAECLPSVFKINYPTEKYEVIVVDNDSKDDSIAFIKKKFPQVKLVCAKQNLGFTGGNNLGYENSKGEYIVLLNSDTTVDQDWLTQLVKAAEPENVGVVTSKLFFHAPFLKIEINSTTVTKSEINHGIDFSPIGVTIDDLISKEQENNDLIWYESGVYFPDIKHMRYRPTKGNAVILLPLSREKNVYKYVFAGFPLSTGKQCHVRMKCGKRILQDTVLEPGEVKEIYLKLEKSEWESEFQWLIQNAGTILLRNGYGKDRGSLLRLHFEGNLEFYDYDSEAYQKPRKVAAMCGASCLIKKSVINELEFLDGHYFMYYEDVEFSVRTLRSGWDIMFEPKSVVYHRHRATTGKTESSFFLQMIERNHLALVITHFPILISLKEIVNFLLRLGITIAKAEIFRFRDDLPRFHLWKLREQGRIQVFNFLFKHLFRLIWQKLHWLTHSKRNWSEIEKLLY